jgi:glyoxylase-like metal-dependent hydrolase (beta-lactamase superfamily II)
MSTNGNISRRNWLKGIGVGAAATGLAGAGLIRPQAQISGPGAADAIAFFRYNVGDLSVTVMKDGSAPLNTEILANNVEPAEVQEALTANNLPTDQLLNTFNVMMIDYGDGMALVDTGLGMGGGPGGRLFGTLALLGVAPGDINHIIGTHFHPDHVGGLSSEGAANFPNATYHLSQTEYDVVQANAEGFAAGAAAAIAPYADGDQLALYNDGDELLPGIQAMATPGHTPGHHAVMLSSNGDSLIHVVDSIINATVHVQNPTFAIQFDGDPVMAADTRTALLSRAADEQIPIMGYHFPFPGTGYVARMDDSFTFVPYS